MSDNHYAIDSLLPAEMATRAEHIGVEKTRLDPASLMGLAVLAGALIGFGSMLPIVVAPGSFPNLDLLLASNNLVWVTVGNMIGGMAVGLTYWFIYLRSSITGSKP